MALLDQGIANAFGIGKKTVTQPTFVANDFPEGFNIKEFLNGTVVNELILKGPFMPQTPFSFGGEQRLATEYYPGNAEPTVQVLGSKEKDLTIKGHFRLKRFKEPKRTTTMQLGKLVHHEPAVNVREIATAYQEALEAMRIHGNVCKIQMGNFVRWVFIQEAQFDFKTLAEINYEIKFLVVGLTPPTNTKIVDEKELQISRANTELLDYAVIAIANMKDFPTEMPQGISAFLTDKISTVASAINIVTGFVDGVLTDAEKLQATVNRSIGLIKNARATISRSVRRIGEISTAAANLGSSVGAEWNKSSATIKNANHVLFTKGQMFNLLAFLAALQKQFQAMVTNVPMVRHSVKNFDTLQNVSTKYYQTPDNWKKIYDHNKLSSTQLTEGSVLEIPKA